MSRQTNPGKKEGKIISVRKVRPFYKNKENYL